MNSRDAAYEQEMQMLIQVTAAEAAAAEASRDGKEPLVDSPAAMNGQAPDSREEGDTVPEPEPEIASGRRKRKRTDEERCVLNIRVLLFCIRLNGTRLQQCTETRTVRVDGI